MPHFQWISPVLKCQHDVFYLIDFLHYVQIVHMACTLTLNPWSLHDLRLASNLGRILPSSSPLLELAARGRFDSNNLVSPLAPEHIAARYIFDYL